MKQIVVVSGEMSTLIGPGAVPQAAWPTDAVVFEVGISAAEGSRHLKFRDRCDLADLENCHLTLVVSRAACERLFSVQADPEATWHLPASLVELSLSIVDCEAPGEAATTLRLARSIELLCQIHAALISGALVRTQTEGALTERDVTLITSARRVVDQRWQEKLTIAELSRVAGVNRDKLVRGFRELYGMTISEALSERRLAEARRMLLVSDLPVATVAYRCSYLNNAAFSRAFARKFGLPPSELRRTRVAA